LAVRSLEDRHLLSGGVYAYTPGTYASWGVGQSFAGSALDSGTVGIDLHVVWNMIQTGPTTYDWTHLDSTIQQAEALGLKVCLMLSDGPTNVPAFVMNNASVAKISLRDTNPYHSTYGQVLSGPVFWDPTYLADRVAFIQAVGARYTNNPDVVAVTCGAANWYTDDWQVPSYVGPITIHGTNYQLNQVTQWLGRGYTDAAMQSAIQQVMDATATAFPHQSLKMEVGVTAALLDVTASALATDAVTYGYNQYAGRFFTQLNFLTPQGPLATDPTLGTDPNSRNYIFYLLAQHPGQVGLQMLASATSDPADGYRQNGLVVAPAVPVTQNAVSIGLSYQPLFLEYWTDDCTNPALAGIIQGATATMEGGGGSGTTASPSILAAFVAGNGLYPEARLVQDRSGNLYGIASTGGASGDGTVFEVAAGSGTITTLASFNGANGSSPLGGLVLDAGGNLYGTAYNGGASGDGTVFELVKGSGAITALASFDGTDGAYPAAGLVLDANGNLYGTASGGGASNDGTVFEVAKGTGTITTLASFNGTDGSVPVAALALDGNGNLYGTTSQAGTFDNGTVFRVVKGSGTITALASFKGPNGANPYAGVILDGTGNLYGTTYNGGASGYGAVFELIKGSGTITTLASFNGTDGSNPAGALVMDGSGNLYGTASTGGAANTGTVFELTKGSGTITTLTTFTGANGAEPSAGLALDAGGNLYGTAYAGGSSGYGMVFELAHGSSTVTTLASFNATKGNLPQAGMIADANGNMYGTTSGGGAFNDGTVFEVAQGSGAITTLASFDGTNGAMPAAALVIDAFGNLYGTTAFGGPAGCGTVFELAAGSGTITALAPFYGPRGQYPEGGLVLDAAGNLYGTTFAGGATGDGTVFEVVKGDAWITSLASFDGADGQYPAAGLIVDNSGNLYGTTTEGGAAGDGTVFEVAAGSGTVTTLASFNGSNGAEPQGDLVLDSSGNLYGTAAAGGAAGDGTAFEVVAGSGTITTLASFNGTNGSDPQGGLVMDGNGNLYGTAVQGGAFGYGTVFEVARGSGTITGLASFNSTAGGSPYAGLTIDGAGDLYGVVPSGGGADQGTVFELPGAAVPLIDQWTGADSATGTHWSDGANWSLGAPPTAYQTALFTRNATVQGFTATVDAGFTHAIAGLEIDGTWGGTITVNSPLTLTGNLSLASGSFGGSGAVSIAGNGSQWTGGRIVVGAGGFTNTGTLTADTTGGNLVLTGAGTLTNNATMNEAGTNNVMVENGATLSNAAGATFDLTGDGGVGEVGGGTLANAGMLEKTGGTATSTISSSLVNSAAITVQTGTLALASAGGTSTGGTFLVAKGATLDLTGGSTTAYQGTYTGSGGGTVALNSGTLAAGAAGATFNMPGTLFQWAGGAIDVTNGDFTNTGTINDPGTGDIMVTGAGTLNNEGTLNEAGANSLLLENGATLNNAAAATFDLTGDGNIGQSGGGTLANAGTLKKTGGTGTSTISSSIVNSAAITVKTGTLALASAGGTSTGGTFSVAPGSTLDLTGGSTTAYAGTYTGTGLGTVAFRSGTLAVGTGGATFDMLGLLFQWTGGAIDVTNGDFTNTGTINDPGTGDVVVTGAGTLTNDGTLNEAGTNSLLLENGATLNNAAGATFDLTGDGNIGQSAGGTLANAGTLKKTGGTGTSTISSSIANSAAITVKTGTLALASAGGTSTGGTFLVDQGATLDLTGGSTTAYAGTYTGTGLGTVALHSGTLEVGTGGATFDMLGLLFQWTGGAIDVTDSNFTNTGMVTYAGSSPAKLTGAGSLINEQTVLQTSSAALLLENGATLKNATGATYDLKGAGGFTQAGGGTFTNAGTLVKFTNTGTVTIATSSFSNTGTVQVDSGTLAVSALVTQVSGSVLTAGTWTVMGSSTVPAKLRFVNVGFISDIGGTANVTLSGATASFSNLAGLRRIASGASFTLLQGQSLTTTGALTNLGKLTLGTSCLLTVGGAFTQLSTGTLTVELGGTDTAPNFGHLLSTTGTLALAGALNVTSTVVPAVGSSFKILDNEGNLPVTGIFAGLPEGATFTVTAGTTVMTFQITYAGSDGNGSQNVFITRIS
jgi:uncharacterized repeat protein (TIGR03803 family)